MHHVNENVLLEYADGLLEADRVRGVAAHLETCAACRDILRALASARTATASTLAGTSPEKLPDGGLPVQLLRELIVRDAPRREQLAVSFALIIAVAAFILNVPALFVGGTNAFGRTASAITGGLIVLEAALFFGLRRGWYHRALPFVNVAIEVSIPCVFSILLAFTFGPTQAAAGPGQVLWGGLVVFAGFRADRRLSLFAGILGALEAVLIVLFAYPRAGEMALPIDPRIDAVVRGGFLLLCGVGGGFFAEQYRTRAEATLRAIRAQDLMGKYILHERIGAGGMAEVYRATYCPDGGFVKPVALKRVLPRLSAQPGFAVAFREETLLGAMLVHPNVVQILDCGKFFDTYVAVMELIDGRTLRQLLVRGPLPLAALTYCAAELASALAYVHARTGADGEPLHIVHRDLNPPNVLISRIGEVKLADFGVAHASVRASMQEKDRFYGKPAYAAPEQLEGRDVDGRADLFALGITLRQALADREVPAPLEAIVHRLALPDREARFPNATALREALVALEGDAAPYPRGRDLLAAAVREALTSVPAPVPAPTEVDQEDISTQ